MSNLNVPPFQGDPQLQWEHITDFSPGIVQYNPAVGSFGSGTLYSTIAPLGSASFAARCINKPGTGLCPFWIYSMVKQAGVPSGNSPGGHPFTSTAINTGTGTVGGIGNIATVSSPLYSQDNEYSDALVLTFALVDSVGAIYHYADVFWSNTGTTIFDSGVQLWSGIAPAVPPPAGPAGVAFDITSQISTGLTIPYPMLIMGFYFAFLLPSGTGLPYYPNVATGASNRLGFIAGGDFGICSAAFAHVNRVFSIEENNIGIIPGTSGLRIQSDSIVNFSDPPAAFNAGVPSELSSVPITYSLENTSGFGAWGSVSTGELVLIRRGSGAVVVNGDAAYPSSVIKLPAVQGTGGIMQRMSMCNAGAVYVTETNGVWAWNGGNTATKISEQIPDVSCLRQEFQPGGPSWNPSLAGSIGVRNHHDVLNNLVFFPNNWVYDSINNSWWQCEDPNVLLFASWSASRSTSNFIYGTPPFAALGGDFNIYAFDSRQPATSWEWTSNPIPSPLSLPCLQEVEICASYPYAGVGVAQATITVTPQAPPNSNSSFTNNPQSVTFTIPKGISGWRGSSRLGFTENNICINVQAAGGGTGAAPILHEIHLGYTKSRSTGVE